VKTEHQTLKLPIAYIDVRFSVHATEDLEKVKKAVYNCFPANWVEEVTFKKDALKGHYGNPIILFETRIKDEEMIKAFIEKLANSLNKLDKEVMLREADMFVEKNNLYFRLDKQAAFEGELTLHKADPIRIRIHFGKRNVIEICRELGLMP
jgi:RNA binding exosome subunit